MKRYIVPVDVTVHTEIEINAESKEEAIESAYDMLSDSLIDLNNFDRYVNKDVSVDDFEEEKNAKSMWLLGNKYAVRDAHTPPSVEYGYDILVSAESDNEKLEHDPFFNDKVYCFIPDEIFVSASDEELQKYINENYD